MKKIILAAAAVLFLGNAAWALDVWSSSSTAVANTAVQTLCVNTSSGVNRGLLHGVCTDFAVASSSLVVVGSSWTIANVRTIGPIGTTAEGCKYYDIFVSSGMAYFKNNTAAITILYRCY